MRKLSDQSRRRLLRYFSKLDDHDITYVVLRKYEHLPDYVPSDIDLLVDADEFDFAVELAEHVGFERPTNAKKPQPLLKKLRTRPLSVAKTVISSPEALVEALFGSREVDAGDYELRQRQSGAVKLDMVNHLRFPERGGRTVPLAVEELMLDRRKRYEEWYVPSPPDELAHIIVHCLVDYDRTFPEYYVGRYTRLRKQVFSDPTYEAQFKELLELFFGEEARTVFDTLSTADPDSITEPLLVER
ncbi:hypothetical protein ACH9L7_01800 [Haloferax sp. S1W]|uniref:hypothetical protein n=1 Tax=Haloferax sp. S1W TaxID=3377110 RepID=UPI0037C9A5BE